MAQEEANEIIKKILEKYEDDLDNPPIGKPFDQIYNLKTLEPTKEWLNKYTTVIKYLENLGIVLK